MSSINVLIAITNYGSKNDGYLRKILDQYLTLPYNTKIVVYTNTQKDWGEKVDTVVTAPPTSSPRSFPFLARRLFVENIDQYDLFIYSEDDIGITPDHIALFLEVTPTLPPNYVPGFFRYESDSNGNVSLPEIHGSCHWEPDSVERFGERTFARYTNHNMGSYILAKSHLSIAIQSNNYSLVPKRSRCGVIESSVSDVFYDCNLKLEICISDMDNFLIHHMSDRFVGNLGITRKQLQENIDALMDIHAGKLPSYRLFETETKLLQRIFDQPYYPRCNFEIVKAVGSKKQKSILSVGCGSGETEAEMQRNGHEVTAIPLDAVISANAEGQGIKTLPPNFDEALDNLTGKQFDCIIFDQALPHLAEPITILSRFLSLLRPDGTLVATFPNADCSHWRNKRYLSSVQADPFIPFDESTKERSFEALGIHLTNKESVKVWLDKAGLKLHSLTYLTPNYFKTKVRLSMGLFTSRYSPNFMVVAKRK